MYEVLDVKCMMKATGHARKRMRPAAKYQSTLLLKGGTRLDLIPSGSEIRKIGDQWEVHMTISNKEIVKKLAKALDAIAFLC
jgi:hypothetical protein